uniref:EF-hand domain-containing protein n=1 Tax=Globodera pallida TaxID=36090 RepID=A0A183BL46_GLOPA
MIWRVAKLMPQPTMSPFSNLGFPSMESAWPQKLPKLYACPGAFKPNCNIYNCVGCEYTYMLTRGCRLEYVQCSCYYCCEPKYAESCPNGCHNCLLDGPGGCISSCPGAFKPNCNVFNSNCVGCRYSYSKKTGCRPYVECSCYYCCDPKYAESCPNGCEQCMWDGNGGCHGKNKSIGCPGAFKPNCNVFDRNCVGCRYSYSKKTGCRPYVECSCYYCCDPKYAESCPNGCEQCIRDGKGGCHGKFKSIGNSSSSMREPEGNAREGFDMVDVDKNGSISLNEAIAYLGSKENGTLPKHFAKNMSWFADIDLNGNNQIEPGEFDRSLIGVDDQTSG